MADNPELSLFTKKKSERRQQNIESVYHCDYCGRPMKRKIRAYGITYCDKHYKQWKKYGKVLDHNPRTQQDPNEFHIHGDYTFIDLYDKNCNVIAQAIIDTEDLNKVRYTKWKYSKSGYAMNTPKFKGTSIHMSRVILQTDQFVDHKNHNTLDNRKCNLRIVTKSQNAMNSIHKGVSERNNGAYYAYIKYHQKMLNLGVYTFQEEALWARWYAETVLFQDFRYPKEEPFILEDRKQQIKEYVNRKVQRL